MKRLILAMTGLAMVAAACGSGGAVAVRKIDSGRTAGPSPSVNPSSTPSQPPTSPSTVPGTAQTVTVEVWFTKGETLYGSKRTQSFTVAVGRAALTALLDGPSAEEKAAGLASSVPTGTQLLGLSIVDGIATVDLSGGFDSGGGSLSERMRLAQVVYTISQFPTVQGVDFRLDGQPVTAFSGEGIVLDHPQTRTDYQDLLPAIVVDGPVIGASVSSPVAISGTADVFEAMVSYRILDENGKIVAQGTTMASCGTGCRGDFSVHVSYVVADDQRGTIELFEASAKDGSPTNVVDVPVTLTA